ncbi:GNAT family N-acetyltransferase [Luteococcus sp. H138]|uniref:GNAT family N-acetyltransferase n=1 Tax=unclassified Luteococcus TaxID=2639923 RepID=UPI00406C04E3
MELSYVLLPDAWGRGIAEAACRELLARVASEVRGDEPVLIVTQTSNQKALAARFGFVACREFVEFGSAQQLLTASLSTFDA